MSDIRQTFKEIACDSCLKSLRLPLEKYAGKSLRIKCPSCGTEMRTRIEPLIGRLALVAHEDRLVCQRLQSTLNPFFEQVQIAVVAQQVVQIAKTERVDLLLLDVGLPGMLSFELIDCLQANAENRPLKTLLVSSTYRQGAYRRQPQSLYGADGWFDLEKIEQLPEEVKRLFDGDAIAEEPEPAAEVPEDLKQTLLRAVEPLLQSRSVEIPRLAEQIVTKIIERHRRCIAHPWTDLNAVKHLLDDLDIGRHVLSQVSAASRSADRDYLHDAFVASVPVDRPPDSSGFDGAYRSPQHASRID